MVASESDKSGSDSGSSGRSNSARTPRPRARSSGRATSRVAQGGRSAASGRPRSALGLRFVRRTVFSVSGSMRAAAQGHAGLGEPSDDDAGAVAGRPGGEGRLGRVAHPGRVRRGRCNGRRRRLAAFVDADVEECGRGHGDSFGGGGAGPIGVGSPNGAAVNSRGARSATPGHRAASRGKPQRGDLEVGCPVGARKSMRCRCSRGCMHAPLAINGRPVGAERRRAFQQLSSYLPGRVSGLPSQGFGATEANPAKSQRIAVLQEVAAVHRVPQTRTARGRRRQRSDDGLPPAVCSPPNSGRASRPGAVHLEPTQPGRRSRDPRARGDGDARAVKAPPGQF